MLAVDHLDAAVKANAKAREWDARRDAEVEAAYTADGHSLDAISKRLGITLEAVRQRLLARGVTLRPRGGRR